MLISLPLPFSLREAKAYKVPSPLWGEGRLKIPPEAGVRRN